MFVRFVLLPRACTFIMDLIACLKLTQPQSRSEAGEAEQEHLPPSRRRGRELEYAMRAREQRVNGRRSG